MLTRNSACCIIIRGSAARLNFMSSSVSYTGCRPTTAIIDHNLFLVIDQRWSDWYNISWRGAARGGGFWLRSADSLNSFLRRRRDNLLMASSERVLRFYIALFLQSCRILRLQDGGRWGQSRVVKALL